MSLPNDISLLPTALAGCASVTDGTTDGRNCAILQKMATDNQTMSLC